MGLYGRHVLPPLTHWAMGRPLLDAFRARVAGGARGRVLEIGLGSGRNLPFYGAGVDELVGLDPSPEMLALAREAAARAARPVTLVEAAAERLPFASGAFDTVVVTFALCTIPDPEAALGEARRVLRPGGLLRFVEHGRSPDRGVEAWQRRLTPLWRRVAGGCHLDRPTDALIARAGFEIAELRAGYAARPRAMAFLYEGTARPA